MHTYIISTIMGLKQEDPELEANSGYVLKAKPALVIYSKTLTSQKKKKNTSKSKLQMKLQS